MYKNFIIVFVTGVLIVHMALSDSNRADLIKQLDASSRQLAISTKDRLELAEQNKKLVEQLENYQCPTLSEKERYFLGWLASNGETGLRLPDYYIEPLCFNAGFERFDYE